jgi:hypothetical protein
LNVFDGTEVEDDDDEEEDEEEETPELDKEREGADDEEEVEPVTGAVGREGVGVGSTKLTWGSGLAGGISKRLRVD